VGYPRQKSAVEIMVMESNGTHLNIKFDVVSLELGHAILDKLSERGGVSACLLNMLPRIGLIQEISSEC
jgi:hypothetical protein